MIRREKYQVYWSVTWQAAQPWLVSSLDNRLLHLQNEQIQKEAGVSVLEQDSRLQCTNQSGRADETTYQKVVCTSFLFIVLHIHVPEHRVSKEYAVML